MALKGVVIDAGHGGSDPGASGNGIIEKDLTLLISKYMYDRLRELGIPVTMTRTTDETLDSKTRTNRIKDAYGTDKDVIVISNHINAGGETQLLQGLNLWVLYGAFFVNGIQRLYALKKVLKDIKNAKYALIYISQLKSKMQLFEKI